MNVSDILSRTNQYLAGEQLTYRRLEPFFDEVIDDINDMLNAKFPVFSELGLSADVADEDAYDYFPDKYIRKVLIKGAAYKFYIMDEEGSQTADMFGYNYQDALFNMTRDYLDQVPDEYVSDSTGGIAIADVPTGEEPFYHGVMW